MTPAPDERRSSRRRILVVDDEPDIREALEMFLSSVGYLVSTAENGAAAIELAKGEIFDLVITDLRMPGMSGVDTLAALKRIAPGISAIVVSGYISDDSVVRCLEEGAIRVVGKPFGLDELLRFVEHALRRADA